MRSFPAVCVVLMALTLAAEVRAQTPGWSSVAKITNGNCGDGAIAQVVERPGSMNIKLFVGGKQTSEVNVPLAADGSGKADYKGVMGRLVMEVPVGTGKRSLKSSQLDGVCQWLWAPQ